MNYAIGIDIGGTNVAIGIVNPKGYLMKSRTIETDLSIPPKKMLSRINHVIQEMIQQANITYGSIIGIGIGAPGPLDNEKGLITHPPNLKGWRDETRMGFSYITPKRCKCSSFRRKMGRGWKKS